jgi:predicted  nucleic acid-binding Zn-ribbon protein
MRDPIANAKLHSRIAQLKEGVEEGQRRIAELEAELRKANKEREAAVNELQARRDAQAGLHTLGCEVVAAFKTKLAELSKAVEALK